MRVDEAPEPAAATQPPAALPGPPPSQPPIERWLAELGLEPVERAERDGIRSWDLILDGRRRRDLRITLFVEEALGLVAWAHFAPPIGDGFRRSYRRLLRWNDEFPFAKFGVTEDDRPTLTVELAPGRLSADELGLALARIVGIADRLLDESAGWIWLGGRIPAGYLERAGRNEAFLARYAPRLPELFGS